MTREDIIRMAKGVGFSEGMSWGDEVWEAKNGSLERFATLVAAAEREACAKVCDGWLHANGDDCAAAIRSRGEMKEAHYE